MSSATADELMVGVIALILVPLIARRILRGVGTGRLPLYHVRESWQSERGMRIAMRRAGFAAIERLPAPRFIMTARKADHTQPGSVE